MTKSKKEGEVFTSRRHFTLGGKGAWIQEYRFSDSSQYPINSLSLKDLKTGHKGGRRGREALRVAVKQIHYRM